jgi:hypothetical protein
MSRVGTASFIFILGVACSVPAAAADLPKQGEFTVTFYGHGTAKGMAVGKTRYEASYEEDGVWAGDGFGNQMSLHCFGMEGRTDQTRHNRNFCVATDLDGDQIAADGVADPYQNDAKEIRLTGTLAAGTGKYAGISGELKFVGRRGYYRSPTEGTFYAYGTGTGHYQLPQ